MSTETTNSSDCGVAVNRGKMFSLLLVTELQCDRSLSVTHTGNVARERARGEGHIPRYGLDKLQLNTVYVNHGSFRKCTGRTGLVHLFQQFSLNFSA